MKQGLLHFKKIKEPFMISGRLGYYIYGKGKIMDNTVFKKKEIDEKFQDNKKPHLQMRFFVCAKIERLKYRKFYYFKSNFKALIK